MKKKTMLSLVALVLVAAIAMSACALREKNAAEPTAAPTASAAPSAPAASETPAATPAETSASPEATASATPASTATPAPTSTPVVYINPLTGEVTDKDYSMTRPVAVMVENNHSYGMINQGGVSMADIIVEMQVEQITRNMAIFMDVSKVPAIYPIRSARTQFCSTAMAFDAIYVHRGQSADGADWSSTILQYFVDHDDIDLGDGNSYRIEVWPHVGEHGLATSGELLTNTFANIGTRMEHKTPDFDYGLRFTENAAPTDGETANTIQICYPGNKIMNLSYDASKNGYTGYQWDSPYVDNNTGENIVFQNVLVIGAPTTIGADDHYHTLIQTTDVNGGGFFFNGGYAEKITWSRGGLETPYRFFGSDGQELELGVGRTYIAFVSSTYGGATFS